MRNIVYIFVFIGMIVLRVGGSGNKAASATASRQGNQDAMIVTRDNQRMLLVSDDNPNIKAAQIVARDHVAQFINVLQNAKPWQDGFAICVPLHHGSRIAEVWLVDVKYVNRKLEGVVLNEGEFVSSGKTYRKGDKIQVEPRIVDDWRYEDQGTEIGNYTGKVIARIKQQLSGRYPHTK
jgi:uncharacterized protein YegJ (DUF2314 family)